MPFEMGRGYDTKFMYEGRAVIDGTVKQKAVNDQMLGRANRSNEGNSKGTVLMSNEEGDFVTPQAYADILTFEDPDFEEE